MKKLLENWDNFVTERASPENFPADKFPTKLSDVDGAMAQKLVTTGSDDIDGGQEDDVIPVDQDGRWAASELKPSQTSMNLCKACWFALGMLNGTMFGSGGPGGETGAFVSSDKYLMDGHHRWIATAMADPSAQIKGYAVAFPGQQLVAILNTITKGLLGVAQGKPGSGGFEQFKDKTKMVEALTAMATDSCPNGKGGQFTGVAGAMEPGMALRVMEAKTGQKGEAAVEAMANLFIQNLASVPGASPEAVLPGAPARVDMPVIDDGISDNATAKTVAALSRGEVNVNPPFTKQQQAVSERIVKIIRSKLN